MNEVVRNTVSALPQKRHSGGLAHRRYTGAISQLDERQLVKTLSNVCRASSFVDSGERVDSNSAPAAAGSSALGTMS